MASNLAISMNQTCDAVHVCEMQAHLHMRIVKHRKEAFECGRVHSAVPIKSFLDVFLQEPGNGVHRHQAIHEAARRELVHWHREQIVLDLLKQTTVKRLFSATDQMNVFPFPVKPTNNEHHLHYGFFSDGGNCDCKAKSLSSALQLLKAVRIVELAIGLDRGDQARGYNCGDRANCLNPRRPIKFCWGNEQARGSKNSDRPAAQGIKRPVATKVSGFRFHWEILA